MGIDRTALSVAAVLLPAVALFALLHWLPSVNALLLMGLAASVYGYVKLSHRPLIHHCLWLTAFLAGVFVAVYRPEGFDYPLVASAPALHADGEPFFLYVNLSKALAGWVLVVLLLHSLRFNQEPLIQRVQNQWVFTGLTVAVIIVFAQMVLDLAWIPKLPEATLYFLLVNVTVTCVAEEAFFRLLLQRHLALRFQHPYWRVAIPVAVTTLLFAVTHRTALDVFFVVYLVAGAGYALVYALTQRFTAAVAVHAAVNMLHFLLLPYPLPINS